MAGKLAKIQSSNPAISTDLNVAEYVDQIVAGALQLWEHVCVLTQTVNERKGRKAALNETTLHSKIKRVRRAYLVSMLLFCANSECTYPFHLLIADAVEVSGGSSELLTDLESQFLKIP